MLLSCPPAVHSCEESNPVCFITSHGYWQAAIGPPWRCCLSGLKKPPYIIFPHRAARKKWKQVPALPLIQIKAFSQATCI